MTNFKLGDELNVLIDGLGSSGEGVGKVDGFTIFVENALPAEIVKVKLIVLKKNYSIAKMLDCVRPSPDRVEPRCHLFKFCGGCQLQHLSYAAQLLAKENKVEAAMLRIGHLQNVKFLPILAAEEPFYYRNKMQFPVRRNNQGIPQIGCFAKKSHSVVNTEHCFIQNEINNKIMLAVREWISEQNITIYDERTEQGLVRNIMGRIGEDTGEVMVVIVTNEKDLPNQEELVAKLKTHVPNITSVMQNINSRNTNVVLGSQTKLIYGQDFIRDNIGSLSFNISARSFFQVNTKQANRLYQTALDFAELTGEEIVFDVYCGTGTIALFLAQQAKKVYGFEIVAEAIEDAKANAINNDISNVEFVCGDALKLMPQFVEQKICPEVIVLDPPRAGADKELLAMFGKLAPKKIVYVSCNPSSLARDLQVLEQLNYHTVKIRPVDMFPMTSSVESVALLAYGKVAE